MAINKCCLSENIFEAEASLSFAVIFIERHTISLMQGHKNIISAYSAYE